MLDESFVKALAQLAVSGASSKVIEGPEGRIFMVTPNGMRLEDITAQDGLPTVRPSFIDQKVTIQNVGSFIDYVNNYKTQDTALFFEKEERFACAVIDYHSKNNNVEDRDANHCRHFVVYGLEHSSEWTEWTDRDGVFKDQLEFARFFEENADDVMVPDPADLIEMARDMEATRNMRVKNVIRVDSEHRKIEYHDDTTFKNGNGEIVMPNTFKLKIPVFFGGNFVEVLCRIRHRLAGDKVELCYKMIRPDQIETDAMEAVTNKIAVETGINVYWGSDRHICA